MSRMGIVFRERSEQDVCNPFAMQLMHGKRFGFKVASLRPHLKVTRRFQLTSKYLCVWKYEAISNSTGMKQRPARRLFSMLSYLPDKK